MSIDHFGSSEPPIRDRATVDTVIVGAGMAGLCTALTLLEGGEERAPSVVILDASEAGNGRVVTPLTELGHPRELGPARYCTTYHPELNRLLERFSISTEAVPFYRSYPRSADRNLLHRAALLDFDPPPQPGQSAHDYFGREWTPDELRAVCQLAGYGVVGEGNFPAVGAVEVLRTHPESFLSADQEWRRPVHGFSALLAAMETAISAGGAQVQRGFHVSAVRRCSDGLDVDGSVGGLRSGYRAQRVVLALPPRSLDLLQHPWPHLRSWLGTQCSVSLFKGFLQVTPGALQEIDGLSVTGIHPLQKIYVDSRRNTVGWYCDGVAALCCADAARRDSAAFQRDVAGLMTAEVAQLTPDMFLDQPATLHFWPSGVTYGPRLASDNPTVLILEHGVVVASDCLAEPIGWLEGAIESGRAAAKLVGADS